MAKQAKNWPTGTLKLANSANPSGEAQIAFVLKQAEDGTSIVEVCRKAGISDATFCNRRKKYAGLMPSEMKRLRQLEEENGKIGTFQSFKSARRTIAGFEAMLWLRKGFGFSGDWTVSQQNDLVARI